MQSITVVLHVLVLLAGAIDHADAQCNGSAIVYEPGFTNSSITIMTPNYPREFGKSANCTWIFNNTGGSYFIELLIQERRLHYVDQFNNRFCTGSYAVFENGGTMNCLPPVQSLNESVCTTYYNPTSCVNASSNPLCEPKQLSTDTLRITYQSDGTMSQNQTITGFVMQVKFNECTEKATTPIVNTLTTQSTSQPTEDSSNFRTSTYALAGVAGVLLLVIIALVIYIIVSKRKENRTRRSGDTPDGVYENPQPPPILPRMPMDHQMQTRPPYANVGVEPTTTYPIANNTNLHTANNRGMQGEDYQL